MPEVEIFKGLNFFFYSEARDKRIHIHARSQDGFAKFWLEPEIELAKNSGVKPKDLRVARKRIEEMRGVYIDAWKEHHGK